MAGSSRDLMIGDELSPACMPGLISSQLGKLKARRIDDRWLELRTAIREAGLLKKCSGAY